MRLRPLGVGIVLAVGASAAAHAQQTGQMPQIQVQRAFHADASVNTFYDSNFARSSKELAATRGISLEDYVASPGVNLNVVQPFGREALFVRGSAGYDFHRYNSQLDRGRVDGNAGGIARLGICQVVVMEAFAAQQSDLAQEDTTDVRNLRKIEGTTVGAQCARKTGFNGQVLVSRQDTKNSATVQKPADVTARNLSVQVGYTNPTLGQLGLVYGYDDNQFPNRIIPGRPVGDGFLTTTYGVSLGHDFGKRLSLQAQVGRTQVKREFAPPGARMKFQATTYSADAAYHLGQRIAVEAHGVHTVKPSARVGKLYDVASSLEGVIRYKLGPNITITAGYRYELVNSNQDTQQLVTRPVISHSVTYTPYGSVAYHLNDKATLTLDVRQEDRTTNLPQFNYISNRVGLTAHVGF